MAHFAKINEQNEVLSVLYIEDSKIMSNGVESEQVGQQYLEKHNNWPANLWIKTSYSTYQNTHRNGKTPFRGNYAGIGYTWDEDNQIFWPKKPHASWTKNISTASWDSPITYPTITTYDSTWTQEEIDAETAAENSSMPAGTNAGDPKTRNYIISWDESSYQADNNTGWKATKHDDSTVSWNGTAWV